MSERFTLQDGFEMACSIIGENVVFEKLRAREAREQQATEGLEDIPTEPTADVG